MNTLTSIAAGQYAPATAKSIHPNPNRDPEIQVEMKKLSESGTLLLENLKVLHSRLVPVLSQEPAGSEATAIGPSAASSPLAAAMDAETRKIHEASALVRSIANRIEV